MRFLHGFQKSTALRRVLLSSSKANQHGSPMARIAAARTHDVSTATNPPPPRYSYSYSNSIIRFRGNGCHYAAGDLVFENHSWQDIKARAFSSNGSDGDADTAMDVINQTIITSAESGDIAKAEQLLRETQAKAIISQDDNNNIFPDIDSFTALINACIDEQKRLLSVIDLERSEIECDGTATMTNEHAAEDNERGAVAIMTLAEKINYLVIQMEDISGVSDHYSSMRLSGSVGTELRDASLKPTSHHYDSAISAFANAVKAAHNTHYTSHLTKNAPYIAQRWLQRMETLAFDPHSGVTPTVDSYFHVMEAAAASDTEGTILVSPSKQHSKAPLLAQSTFDKLKSNTNIYPTVREYRLLLQTWCRSCETHREAAYQAMGLWMTMQTSFKDGDEEMEPTLDDGKMILEAWTKSINKHAARRAQGLLSTMETMHANKKTKVKPDLDCYRNVLITMARSKAAWLGTSIPPLFKQMEDNEIHPDTVCFDAAIETLKNSAKYSKDAEGVTFSRATEHMLDLMEKAVDRSSVSVVTPSAVTYTNVIQALSAKKTVKNSEKADHLLKKMEEAYANGDNSMRPTKNSYIGVIHGYGNSGSEFNFSRANDVLQRMINAYAEGNEEAHPHIGCFHAVIRACARASQTSTSKVNHNEALLLAISTVQYMKKSEFHAPTAQSYLLLLQGCASLLKNGSSEREKALQSIFRSCAKDGLVNQFVLKEFQGYVSEEMYHKEVVQDAPSYNGTRSLPETWTRSLGYRARTDEVTADGVRGKRTPIISVNGEVVASTAYNDHRMRRRWSKKNQKLLQGGRM